MSAAGKASRARRRARVLLLALVGVLYALSIPWYRSPDPEPGLLFGLPDWAAVALGCYAAAAVCNAVAWLLTEVPDAEAPGEEEPP